MTFLQPSILWALPLILLPVIIHLLNRLRHRPRAWAAMQFLLAANRSSTSHARLRQWLILLFRTLAVLALILFVARPLSGGWLGWALSPAPDAIVILLDRSPSMEADSATGDGTKREQALKLLAGAARQFEDSSHLILIENALREPQQIAGADALGRLSTTGPSDAAADIPAMLQTAFQWLVDNQAGASEIWIASDLQASNWRPEDDRWASMIAQLDALPQPVRVRLLAFNENGSANAMVSLSELTRRTKGSAAELDLAFDIRRDDSSSETVPVTVSVDGKTSQVETLLEGQSVRWRQRVDAPSDSTGGWGSVSLPDDGNGSDNTAYFVYGSDTAFAATVVSSDDRNARFLRFAASTRDKEGFVPAKLASPNEAASAVWESDSLLVWQAPLPKGDVADRVRTFVEEGGVAVFFPTAEDDAVQFQGMGWGALDAADGEDVFGISIWEENEGPLANTDEGLRLPVDEFAAIQRRRIKGGSAVLAAFEDETPFLTRRSLGRGRIYFCGSLPTPEWSSLGDGFVLVPILRRALAEGGRRLNRDSILACGELNAVDRTKPWTLVDSDQSKDILSQAGVYRHGDRLVAVNRPESENEPTVMEADTATGLFGELPVRLWEETGQREDRLQGEIWRLILCAMLVFLMIEAVLILPATETSELAKEAART
ncbi:MAG: hypothetical protein ACI8V5_004425 [Limisphaerales bacterium]|jgi:hypothetical protein